MFARPRFRSFSRASSAVLCIIVGGCTGPTDPQSSLRLEAATAANVTVRVGMTVDPAPAVRLTDKAARPVPGVRVSFAAANGGTILTSVATTDNNGVASAGTWTVGLTAQTYKVHAQVKGLDDIVFTAVAVPGPPTTINAHSGDRQIGNTSEPLPEPVRVVIRDAFGNTVSGSPVTFAVMTGGGSIADATVGTDSSGIATGFWILGTEPGAQQLRVSVDEAHVVLTAIACDPVCQSFELLFARNGNVYRTNLGGRGETVVVYNGHTPTMSPDGRHIAFVRWDDNGERHVYVTDVNGSQSTRRVDHAHSPSWSPDGRLVVAKGDCIHSCGIFVLNAFDDSPPIGIGSAAQPAWSPDGKRIAFVSLSGDDGYHELQVMNLEGPGITVVSPRDPGAIAGMSWSPDGKHIAFSKCIDGGCDILVASADGSKIERRTDMGNAIQPAWSPDGTRIAMVLREAPLRGSLAYIDAQTGGDPIAIVTDAWTPTWFPLRPGSNLGGASVRRGPY